METTYLEKMNVYSQDYGEEMVRVLMKERMRRRKRERGGWEGGGGG